jgi:uncharacterized Zn-finger protein
MAGLPLDEEKAKSSLFDLNILQTLAQSLAYSYQATTMFPFLSQQFGMGLGLNLGNEALNAAALYSAAAAQANNFFLNNKKTPIMMDTGHSSSLLHPSTHISSSLKCPEPNCNKVFTRAYNLKSHQLSHSGVRPYQCSTCQTSFVRKHDLKRHERLHSGIKPYVCEICKRGFYRSDALARHERSGTCSGSHHHHNSSTSTSSTSKTNSNSMAKTVSFPPLSNTNFNLGQVLSSSTTNTTNTATTKTTNSTTNNKNNKTTNKTKIKQK